MTIVGKVKKELGVKSLIERTEKRLAMLHLTQKYGIKAHEVADEIFSELESP